MQTMNGLKKALSTMFEKTATSNKIVLIQHLVNTKMKEGDSVSCHINEFNSIISRLVWVDIKFEDEVCPLLLLSSPLES